MLLFCEMKLLASLLICCFLVIFSGYLKPIFRERKLTGRLQGLRSVFCCSMPVTLTRYVTSSLGYQLTPRQTTSAVGLNGLLVCTEAMKVSMLKSTHHSFNWVLHYFSGMGSFRQPPSGDLWSIILSFLMHKFSLIPLCHYEV